MGIGHDRGKLEQYMWNWKLDLDWKREEIGLIRRCLCNCDELLRYYFAVQDKVTYRDVLRGNNTYGERK